MAQDIDVSLFEAPQGKPALEWVSVQNAKTAQRYANTQTFKTVYDYTLELLSSPDKLVYPKKQDGFIYNMWTDKAHQRGLWRRCLAKDYENGEPKWEKLLSIDELNSTENRSWVLHSIERNPYDSNQVLIGLSDGGKDAYELREFDVNNKQFVKNGFYIPEAKSDVTWEDKDTLLVASDFGSNTLTASGYPRQLKRLKRGQRLDEATMIAECAQSDLSIGAYHSVENVDGKWVSYTGCAIAHDFYRSQQYIFRQVDGVEKLCLIDIPEDASVECYFKDKALVLLKNDWHCNDTLFKANSIVSIDLDSITQSTLDVELVFEPKPSMSIPTLIPAKDYLYLWVMDNVRNQLYTLKYTDSKWHLDLLKESMGTISPLTCDSLHDNELYCSYADFLTPNSIVLFKEGQKEPKPIQQGPVRFDSDPYVVQQYFAKSQDGTTVPYFVVHNQAIQYDGKNPTWLNAYGGFESVESPYYLGLTGKLWLDKGGVYVLGNIRGGGEFGPKWHQAGLQENRQKVFDDFTAIAQDLHAKKITSKDYLGIQGGSNGGLLMGVAFTQHPELYNAVLCQVPLLDMLNYDQYLAGHSWVAEYGDPSDPKMREVISAYSPLQNVKPDQAYPEVFIMTSTADDRVHPVHARKMAHKLMSMNYPVVYYENIEGGHGGAADLKQRAYWSALEYCYLYEKICHIKLQPESKLEGALSHTKTYVPKFEQPNALTKVVTESEEKQTAKPTTGLS